MTESLAQEAWTKFQAIEAAGGINAFRSSGALKADIDAVNAARAEAAAPIVGVTLHPAPDLRKAKVRKPHKTSGAA